MTDVASAHAIAVSRLPPPDADLRLAPTTVRLEFNEALEGEFSSITVTDDDARVAASKQGKGLCAGKVCELALPELKPGKYTISYSILSRDGHVVKASYSFSVKAKAP